MSLGLGRRTTSYHPERTALLRLSWFWIEFLDGATGALRRIDGTDLFREVVMHVSRGQGC